MEKFNFTPKQWVLVRDEEDEKWALAQFSNMGDEAFVVIGGIEWGKCIPYESNEHLLGTADDYVKPYEPKDGDFVYVKCRSSDREYLFIKGDGDEDKTDYYFCYCLADDTIGPCAKVCGDYEIKEIRLTTDSEKQQLLDALHENGKDWDESKKEIVEYRWKPKQNKDYWFINSLGVVSKTYWSEGAVSDTQRYTLGNCFRTREEAVAMADKFKELLKNK